MISRQKLEEIYQTSITAQEAAHEELPQAELQRAQRVEDAAARGITLNEAPIDPEAAHAIALTSSPGLVAPPSLLKEPEASTQVKRQTV